MVEVLKTNVQEHGQAKKLIRQIHRNFQNYQANFDLEDCDKILRVACYTDFIQATQLIDYLKILGYKAEVLMDSNEAIDGCERSYLDHKKGW